MLVSAQRCVLAFRWIEEHTSPEVGQREFSSSRTSCVDYGLFVAHKRMNETFACCFLFPRTELWDLRSSPFQWGKGAWRNLAFTL